MHNSYFFLNQLTQELNERLSGFSVVSCFSQNKAELIIELNNRKESFFIKAYLQPDFCCLSFPPSFNRARKNSVDLLQNVVLKEVKEVRQFKNERSFALILSDGFSLLFKMHGNRSNIILCENGVAKEIFRNHLKPDLKLKLDSLNRSLDWTYDYFKSHQSDLKKAFFTLSNENWNYLASQGFTAMDQKAQWTLLQSFHHQLNKGEYYIMDEHGEIGLTLYPAGQIIKQHKIATEAINDFFLLRLQTGALGRERNQAMRAIQEKEKQVRRYLEKNKALLESTKTEHTYQLSGDLIMANLSAIRKGEEKVVLENYFNPGQTIEIKLKKELTPQKNAEIYFRKAKNQRIEIEKLSESIQGREKELAELLNLKLHVQASDNLLSLKKILSNSTLLKSKAATTERLPYREVEFNGYTIRIGRSASDNDELTLKHSYKEDLWLHAKDVSGSHVVVKHQSGKNFPKDVIERAAQLAAFHSKRKNESLCPVAVTNKKYVRKRKGDPAGMVVVEKEKVILVEPKE
jgi:predicted ribosome quality control (RQC) complex YloA/Tae2 family protein